MYCKSRKPTPVSLHSKKQAAQLQLLKTIIDERYGLMKVGGRLYQSELDDNVEHPFLIDAKSHFTRFDIINNVFILDRNQLYVISINIFCS